ncbi:hypothetical protein HZ993_09940 [Rhodoferax sp. AJA081-3]|uniref:tetratricopeptide repeat protein n=1 Tax=Rhodoferax sp. AJA081-3 TaxID=2752316 RepID=UPI001ADF3C37|nr:tetratricopeptide repeat protein [Rhodoferax sp. AJA081-3]QTN30087.1 hypothetical protein HZ993_09940 [Rhodoferax sp. AJA081-3]
MIDKKTPILATRLVPIALCLSTITAPAFSQSTPLPTAQEVEQAFQEVIGKAASIEARTKYASLLVRSGNFEGGIAALEGLLIAPDAPASIRVELGVLYFRLGSYAISETYLRAAIDDPRLDPPQKRQAESLLREVVRRNQRSQLSGSLMLGVRTQSNPTAASDNDPVYYQGNPIARGKDAGPKSDTDVHLWGTLDHVFDLDQQNEASIVTSLVMFANHYNSVSSYSNEAGSTKPSDLALIAGSTGLRFKPMRLTAPALSIRPHLVFGSASANGNSYFTAGGWGIDGDFRPSETLLLGGSYENGRLVFSARSDIANSQVLGGSRQSLKMYATVETSTNQFLSAELGYVDFDGNAPYTAFKGPQAKIGYTLTYPAPISSSGLPWTTTLSVHTQQRDYRGADATVDARTVRKDTEWRWSMMNVMPVTRAVSVQLQLDHTNIPSNIPNYTHTNTAGTLGVIWKY